MKQKKFSQIYREAAESLFKIRRFGCCYHIHIAEYGFYSGEYLTDVQEYFTNLFYEGNPVVAKDSYYFGGSDLSCTYHRITALLLASEIAKSEGL